jgi:hypothetical protein
MRPGNTAYMKSEQIGEEEEKDIIEHRMIMTGCLFYKLSKLRTIPIHTRSE